MLRNYPYAPIKGVPIPQPIENITLSWQYSKGMQWILVQHYALVSVFFASIKSLVEAKVLRI